MDVQQDQSINPLLDQAEHCNDFSNPQNIHPLKFTLSSPFRGGKNYPSPKTNLQEQITNIQAVKLQKAHLTKAPRNCNLFPQELKEHKTLKNVQVAFLMANEYVK